MLKELKNAKKVKGGPMDRPTDQPTNQQSRMHATNGLLPYKSGEKESVLSDQDDKEIMTKVAYFVKSDNSTLKYEAEFYQPGSAFVKIAIKDKDSPFTLPRLSTSCCLCCKWLLSNFLRKQQD